MIQRSFRLGITALALVAGPVLVAQTTTTGALNGTVTDKSGAPVAGAIIRFTSGQITRTISTGPDGRYSLGLLNAGQWTLSVSRQGFSSSHQTVLVSINTTTTTNFKLAKETGATVEVVGTSTNVDATSVTTGSNFTLETISAVPKGRDIADLAYMTPGVTTSGFGSNNGNGGLGLEVSIAGASGAENSFSVDGLKTNDMRYGGQSVVMVNEFVDQVDVQTGGFKPEYSAMGGVFNILTKSGSNEFAGSAWATHSPSSLSPNPKQTLWYREMPAPSVSDVGAWVGGPIMKDKFFYSVGLNYNYTNSGSYRNFSNLNVGGTKTPDLQFMAKLQYYLSSNNQLTLTYFGNNQTESRDHGNAPTTLYDGRGTADTSGDTKHDTSNVNLIWDSTLASNLSMSIKAGQAHLLNQDTPDLRQSLIRDQTYYAAGGPGANEGVDPRTYWAAGASGNISKETNTTTQFAGDLTWVVGGDHALKFGYSYLKSNYSDKTDRNGGQTWMIRNVSGRLRAIQNFYHNDSEANATFQAVYLQDTWQISKGLNVFYGFRAEDQKQVGANGSTFMHFKFADYIQPRLGFTWDVVGDGRSKVSGNFAWYYMQIPQRMAIRTYGKEEYFLRYYGGGGDNGSTASYDRATSTVTVTGEPYDVVDYSSGWSNDPMADNLKLPKRTEVLLGYDQQLSDTTSVGIHAKYRKLTNPIEDSVITRYDAGSDSWVPVDPEDSIGQAIVWNPGPSASWTSLTGKKISTGDTRFPEAYNEYKAVDVSYTYRTSTAFLFLGYTWSRDYGTYEGLISATNGQPDGGITASYDYWPYVGTGYLPNDHTHQFKAYGYKKLKAGPGDLSIGFNFLVQSGRPYSLQDDGQTSNPVLPDIGSYMNATFQDLKMGNKGRLPTQTRLDLTFHYEMPLGKRVRLEPLFEIYNVMNHRPPVAVLEQYTDRYGEVVPEGRFGSATDYAPRRSFRFGAKLRF